MLGAGALGRPRGVVWGGRREEGSGWGTHVYLRRIHFDIWIGVSYHFLLQRIILTQGLNLHLLHWQVDSSSLSHQGRPHHRISNVKKELRLSLLEDRDSVRVKLYPLKFCMWLR